MQAQPDIPRYSAVAIVAALIRLSGLIMAVLGATMIILAASRQLDVFANIGLGLGMVMAGLFYYAAGEALSMFRDLCRNSFRHVQPAEAGPLPAVGYGMPVAPASGPASMPVARKLTCPACGLKWADPATTHGSKVTCPGCCKVLKVA